ncbi:hypothetical protein MRX96_049638, partial [Rhipicephalus microplus]
MSVIEQASYKTFLNGKPVSEGLVRTVLQTEEALLQASKFLKCSGALSTSSITEEDLTTKLLGQTTVLDGSFYNKKCAGTTAAEGAPCLPCRYLRKSLLTRLSRLRNRRHKQSITAAQKLRCALQRQRRF